MLRSALRGGGDRSESGKPRQSPDAMLDLLAGGAGMGPAATGGLISNNAAAPQTKTPGTAFTACWQEPEKTLRFALRSFGAGQEWG